MMFFKTTIEDSGLFRGYTDWHSHLLPGVDDGIKTFDDALHILRRYEELGVSHVWLTPHVMEDYPNRPADLRDRFAELIGKYSGNIQLHLGSENMLDCLFERRLETNDLLPITDEADHLLVETSYFSEPVNFWETIDLIQCRGYHVVLAHPERYRYMDHRDYIRLKEKNVKFQLNVPSLSGFYGRQAHDNAKWLLSKGYYDLSGFDLHSVKSLDFILHSKVRKSLLSAVNALQRRHNIGYVSPPH